jgi:Holliday junction resolvase RusA-like endonuclease
VTALVEFEVIGIPKPQGSMKAFSAGGQARMKPSGGAAFAAWRNAVAQAAHDVATELGEALDGPLVLSVEFRFPMPGNATKAAKTRGWRWKVTAPDTDKLVRTIGDALTASKLIVDDKLLQLGSVTKIETTEWTGAIITIDPMWGGGR